MFDPTGLNSVVNNITKKPKYDVVTFRSACLRGGYNLVRLATGNKRPVAKNWLAGEDSSLLLTPSPSSANTGLVLTGFWAIDVDVDDPAVASRIANYIRKTLPKGGLWRWRENSPRFAVLYRAETDSNTKKSVAGPYGKIEVLATGQQLMIDGCHPSGVNVTWEGNRSPSTVKKHELPILTESEISELLRLCEKSLGIKEDFTPHSLAKSIAEANAELGSGLEQHNWFSRLNPLEMVQLVKACLDQIDNRTLDERDTWRDTVFSVHAATDLGCFDGERLALDWSRRGARWTSEQDFHKLWDSYRPGFFTAGTLLGFGTDAGLDLAAWRQLAMRSQTSDFSNQDQDLNESASAPRQILKTAQIAQLPTIPAKRRWLHGTDLMRGAVSLLVAPGARGKSTWLMTLAIACASGQPILGSKVFGSPLRVLYLNAEDSTDELNRRLRAAMVHHRIPDSAVSDLHLAGAEGARLSLLAADKGTARLDSEGWSQLTETVQELKPDILMIDPLVSIVGGVTLNDNSAAALMMTQFVKLAAEYNLGVMIAHHAAKFREAKSAEAAMGAASLVNLSRICLAVEPLNENDALKIGVMPWDARSVFRIVGTKQNFSPPSQCDRWFKLDSVDLGNAEPPVYPEGDRVAVVEKLSPATHACPFPQSIMDAALLAISQANPALSPSRRSKVNSAANAVATAISKVRATPASDHEGQALVDYLMGKGAVRAIKVKVSRTGRGAYERDGLEVVAPPTTPTKANHLTGVELVMDGLGAAQAATKQEGVIGGECLAGYHKGDENDFK